MSVLASSACRPNPGFTSFWILRGARATLVRHSARRLRQQSLRFAYNANAALERLFGRDTFVQRGISSQIGELAHIPEENKASHRAPTNPSTYQPTGPAEGCLLEQPYQKRPNDKERHSDSTLL